MQTTPVTEVLVFKTPEGLDLSRKSSEQEQFLSIMQTVLNRVGCRGGSWGLQIEDPSVLWIFLHWDCLESHLEFQSSASYEPFTKQLRSLMEKRLYMFHVSFSSPPTATLTAPTAPVTELWRIFFEKDISQAAKDSFEQSLTKFLEAIKDTGTTTVARGWSCETVPVEGRGEEGIVYLCCIGWQSVDAHMAAKQSQAFQANTHLIRGHPGQLASAMIHYSGVPFKLTG